jgi:hypothetical protein
MIVCIGQRYWRFLGWHFLLTVALLGWEVTRGGCTAFRRRRWWGWGGQLVLSQNNFACIFLYQSLAEVCSIVSLWKVIQHIQIRCSVSSWEEKRNFINLLLLVGIGRDDISGDFYNPLLYFSICSLTKTRETLARRKLNLFLLLKGDEFSRYWCRVRELCRTYRSVGCVD